MAIRKAQIFFGSNGTAAHLFYEPSNGAASDLVDAAVLDVIFPGLPHTPYFHELEKLVTAERAVMYIHYPGSWYSSGVFTPESCRNTVSEVVQLLQQGRVTDVYTGVEIRVSPKETVFVGNSFGGYLVYQGEHPHKRVLLAPLLVVNPEEATHPDTKKVLQKVSSSIREYPKSIFNVYRGISDPQWESFINDPASEKLLSRENAEVFVGEQDTLITTAYVADSLEGRSQYKLTTCPCGHDFQALYLAYVGNSDRK